MNQERQNPDPEHILKLKDELMERFRALPTEHQATMALVVVKTVMEGEWSDWLKEAIALRYPSEAPSENAFFSIPRLSREALEQVGLNEEEIARLTDDDLTKITHKIAEHYVTDWYWEELKFHAREVLDKRQKP